MTRRTPPALAPGNDLAGNVKSAATAWLRGRGEQARFDFTRPEGAPVRSVMDIHVKERGPRAHLDGAVAPVWDDEREPVLGVPWTGTP